MSFAQQPKAGRRRGLRDRSNAGPEPGAPPSKKASRAPAAGHALAPPPSAYYPPFASTAPLPAPPANRLGDAASAARDAAFGAVSHVFQDEEAGEGRPLMDEPDIEEGEGDQTLDLDDSAIVEDQDEDDDDDEEEEVLALDHSSSSSSRSTAPAPVFRPAPQAPVLSGPLISLPRDVLPSEPLPSELPAAAPAASAEGLTVEQWQAAAERNRACGRLGPLVAAVGSLPHGVANNVPDYQEPLLLYDDDIFQSLRGNELRTRPNPNYMDAQADLTANMRSILVDWLVEVADEFELRTQTLHISVRFVDRYLTVRSEVRRNRLQLVGCVCMFVAAKYEEVDPPTVDDFVHIADNTYTREEMLRTEADVLKALGFAMCNATPFDFLRRFSDGANMDRRERYLTRYLVERFLQEPAFLRHRPSVVCAAATSVALMMTGKAPWTARMQAASMMEWSEVYPCVLDLAAAVESSFTMRCKLRAVYNKYGDDRFAFVSKMRPPSAADVPRPHSAYR